MATAIPSTPLFEFEFVSKPNETNNRIRINTHDTLKDHIKKVNYHY